MLNLVHVFRHYYLAIVLIFAVCFENPRKENMAQDSSFLMTQKNKVVWWQNGDFLPGCILAYIQCFIGDSGKTNHTEPKSA